MRSRLGEHQSGFKGDPRIVWSDGVPIEFSNLWVGLRRIAIEFASKRHGRRRYDREEALLDVCRKVFLPVTQGDADLMRVGRREYTPLPRQQAGEPDARRQEVLESQQRAVTAGTTFQLGTHREMPLSFFWL